MCGKETISNNLLQNLTPSFQDQPENQTDFYTLEAMQPLVLHKVILVHI